MGKKQIGTNFFQTANENNLLLENSVSNVHVDKMIDNAKLLTFVSQR